MTNLFKVLHATRYRVHAIGGKGGLKTVYERMYTT